MMRGGSLSFDIGSALLSEYDGDDFPGLQIAEYGDNATCPTMEMHAPYGLYHRPLDPDKDENGKPIEGRAAQVLYAWEGSAPHAWLQEDPRIVKLLPKLKKGESLFYGPTSNFVRCHADGRVAMYTTHDGTPTGLTIARYVSPDPLIGGIVDTSPWGNVKLNQTGYHVVTRSGAEMHCGGIGGLPGAASYCNVKADAIGLQASTVTLGAGPTFEPVAKATTLQEYMALVLDVLAQITLAMQSPPVPIPDFLGNVKVSMAVLAAATPLLLQVASTATSTA